MKALTKLVQALAVVAAVVFLGLLFLNEPDEADVAGGDGEQVDGGESDGGEVEGGGEEEGGDAALGAAVYVDSCARCHGSDGGGGIGPQLSEGQVVENFPDPADQIAIVTDGQGGMPAFGSRLSPEEIEAVVEFTREL